MPTVKQVVRKFIPRPIQTPPPPVDVDQSAYSAIFSEFDDDAHPTPRLIDLAIDAVERAMKDVQVRGSTFPGDDLCLIGGLILAMRPNFIAQIGSRNEQVSQIVNKYLDHARHEIFERVDNEIAGADLILINGPADGESEKRILDDLAKLKFAKPPIVMLNDTRRWEMLRFVREIRHPKLDMTSFGRWTGTLLLEIV